MADGTTFQSVMLMIVEEEKLSVTGLKNRKLLEQSDRMLHRNNLARLWICVFRQWKLKLL